MPSRDARSHGTDVPWNGDEEDWPRARDMYHAILRDEFGSDIADTMWYDKVPTDSFDFDVETACLSILNCEKRRNFKLAQSWERDDEFWTEGWVRWWFDEAKQKMFDLLRPYTSDRANSKLVTATKYNVTKIRHIWSTQLGGVNPRSIKALETRCVRRLRVLCSAQPRRSAGNDERRRCFA